MDIETLICAGKLPELRRRKAIYSEESVQASSRPEPVLRPARIAMILALARKYERMVNSRKVESFTDLAMKSGLTKARISQLMDLTLLAPDLQRVIMRLQSTDGIEPVTERGIRKLVNVVGWGEQRREWGRMISGSLSPL